MTRSRISLLLMLGLAAVVAGTHIRGGRAVMPVPGLDPEMGRHLVEDGDPEFRHFCIRAGTLEIKSAMARLEAGMDVGNDESYAASWAAAAPHLQRLASALATEFDCPEYLRDLRVRAAFPVGRRREIELLHRATAALDSGFASLSPEARVARYEQVGARYAELGYARGVMLNETALAREVMGIEARQGDRSRLLRVALADARALGERFMVCQILGDLGVHLLWEGRVDSVLICYEEARRIAMHCRFPDQAGRVQALLARYHLREGRVGLALNCVRESQRVCREFGGHGFELRFVMGAVTMFMELECWEAAERLLDRSAVLLRDLERTGTPVWRDQIRLWVSRYRARLLLSRGEVDRAEQILHGIENELRRKPPRTTYARFLDEWSAGLEDAGYRDRALDVIARGLPYCDSTNVGEVALPLALRRAELLQSLGRDREARVALAAFDRRLLDWLQSEPEWSIRRDVVEARLLAGEGDHRQAVAILGRALDAFHVYARGLDGSAQSHLALASFRTLRLASHEILSRDAWGGYRLEMDWREVMNQTGRHVAHPGPAAAAAVTADFTPGFPRNGASALLPPPGVTHCVYLSLEGSTVRWTASSTGVVCDTLPLPLERTRARVRALLEGIGSGTGTSPGQVTAVIAEELSALAREVLPVQVLELHPGRSIPTLCISADGPLAGLPFEALDLSATGHYEPLALRWDVARIQSLQTYRHVRASGPPSVVADPAIPPALRRRYGIDTRLDQAVTEARVAARLWPGARLLTGSAARKDAVLDAWRHAPRIHVAAHMVRSDELPAHGFVPLATPHPNSGEDESCLDPGDVRALDLSGCDLVVLSACASGAPDLSAKRVGPSLADAFLDAGAAAVVQATRPVGDLEARQFMTGFLQAAENYDVVSALGRARRAALHDGPGARDPAAWAAWTVGILGYPRAAEDLPPTPPAAP